MFGLFYLLPNTKEFQLHGEPIWRTKASVHCTFPGAVLRQSPIAMFITNHRQSPLAASLERCTGSSASIATRNRCDSFQSSRQSDLDLARNAMAIPTSHRDCRVPLGASG